MYIYNIYNNNIIIYIRRGQRRRGRGRGRGRILFAKRK
jgi:hypothetical protein